MIHSFYKKDIIDRLGAIITYGLENNLSYESIENYIVHSKLINDLENNSFDYTDDINTAVKSTYQCKSNKNYDISFKALFLSESYINLFFYINKSFEYLFLYLPLEYLIQKYDIYHEMDFSNLKNDFISITKKTPLLKALSRKYNLKLNSISKLSNININSINKYSISDNNLYKAPFQTIHKISSIFEVKDNIFLPKLLVYLDNTIYLFDKSNDEFRSYLGLYFASYYDKQIIENNYTFDKNNLVFIEKSGSPKLVVLSYEKDYLKRSFTDRYDENAYLVIFPYGYYDHSFADYQFLNKFKSKEIMVVTQQNVYLIKKGLTKEISNRVYKSLVIKAKSTVNENNA